MSSKVSELLFGVFSYNKANFKFDREMRQKAEYEAIDMRIEQASLWREDVRNVVELTLTKVEAYLLVIALELVCCVTALCKGRVISGTPVWLISCHTLALFGAFLYLIMAMWLGLHAYVAAQAYKVRILTHFVRLPIPQWQAIEAARTYQSSYEKMKPQQLFRVPVVTGPQEGFAQSGGCLPASQSRSSSAPPTGRFPTDASACAGDAASAIRTGAGCGSGIVQGLRARGQATATVSGEADVSTKVTDPWGLERRAGKMEEEMPELAPDVHAKTERQRHIWLVRQAATFYETYDAFCRISMSTGTCSLATFLEYFCLSYVLTETAAPVAAWCGTLAYCTISLVLLRLDMKLNGREYFCAAFLMVAPALLSCFLIFENSKHRGNIPYLEWAEPVVPFLTGLYYVFLLYSFKVRELESGAMLPELFGSVLYLDAFGWAKKGARFGAAPRMRTASAPFNRVTTAQTFTDIFFGRRKTAANMTTEENPLPAMAASDPSAPKRPEDMTPPTSTGVFDNVSFRPSTFSMLQHLRTGDAGWFANWLGQGSGQLDDRQDSNPGSIPWVTYRWSTIFFALLWFSACGASIYDNAFEGKDIVWISSRFRDLKFEKKRVPRLLQVERQVDTQWFSQLTRPRGLACDPEGAMFVTSGLNHDGQEGLLHAHLSSSGLSFEPLAHCSRMGDVVEDLALHQCGQQGECEALFLPREGERLLPCRLPRGAAQAKDGLTLLQEEVTVASGSSSQTELEDDVEFLEVGKKHEIDSRMDAMALPVGRAWLDDRGALPLDASPLEGDDIENDYGHPEAISAITTVRCSPGDGKDGSDTGKGDTCLVVATTAKRVVQLTNTRRGSLGHAWLPQRILSDDVGEVPGPGAFVLLGERHLGVLLQRSGLLRVLDLKNGGNHTQDFQLPKDRRWSSVCAGGGSLFALEHGNDPSLFRFAAPEGLVAKTVSHATALGITKTSASDAAKAVGGHVEAVVTPDAEWSPPP